MDGAFDHFRVWLGPTLAARIGEGQGSQNLLFYGQNWPEGRHLQALAQSRVAVNGKERVAVNVAHGQRSCVISTRTAESRVRPRFQSVDFFLPSFRSFRPSHWPKPYSVAIQQKHRGNCSRRLGVDKVAQFIQD